MLKNVTKDFIRINNLRSIDLKHTECLLLLRRPSIYFIGVFLLTQNIIEIESRKNLQKSEESRMKSKHSGSYNQEAFHQETSPKI